MADIKEFGLGRLATSDPRDKRFLLRSLVEDKPIDITSKYWNASNWWGDQGPTPQCVGYSWTHLIADGPVTHKGPKPYIAPQEIYTEAQKIDEWEGEGYEGTSVRAGAKYLQSKGFISEYRWGWDVDTLAKAILTTGPAVIGTFWFDNMFEPDSKGILDVSGSIAGGHAYKVDGVNIKTKLFRIKNSWGRSWGKKGFAYIKFDDMKKLIDADGEICLPIEVKLPSELIK